MEHYLSALLQYIGTNEEKVEFPTQFTQADIGPFSGAKSIKEIIVPNGTKYIKNNAFHALSNVTKITLPEGLLEIGVKAFYLSHSLQEINLPQSITNIKDEAFYGCTNLRNITIPNKITVINYEVFENCKSLTNIIIPEGVTVIMYGAFYLCQRLKSVEIPASVHTVFRYAFANTKIESITFKGDVTLNDAAFYASRISKLTFNGQINSIRENTFDFSSIKTIIYCQKQISYQFNAFNTTKTPSTIYTTKEYSQNKFLGNDVIKTSDVCKSDNQQSDDSDELSTKTIIILIVIISLAVVFLVFSIVYLCKVKKQLNEAMTQSLIQKDEVI